jgi:hypothetical protein
MKLSHSIYRSCRGRWSRPLLDEEFNRFACHELVRIESLKLRRTHTDPGELLGIPFDFLRPFQFSLHELGSQMPGLRLLTVVVAKHNMQLVIRNRALIIFIQIATEGTDKGPRRLPAFGIVYLEPPCALAIILRNGDVPAAVEVLVSCAQRGHKLNTSNQNSLHW